MPTDSWQDDILTLIEDCENREGRMSDWERGFVDSIRRQVENGRKLTPRQEETLDNLWEKVTTHRSSR